MHAVDFFVVSVLSLLYVVVVFFNFFSSKYYPNSCSKNCITDGRERGSVFRLISNIKATILNVFVFKMAIEQSYLNGVLGILLFLICEPFSYLLVYVLLVGKLVKSVRGSIYEWIGYFYGDGVRCIFSIGEIVSNTLFISVNLKIIGEVLTIFNVPSLYINLFFFIFIFVVIFDSLNNSEKNNNIFVSLMRLIVFLFIPFVCIFAIVKFDSKLSFLSLFDCSRNPRMNFSSYFSCFPDAFVSIAMITRFAFPFVDSTMYQNVVVNKSKSSMGGFLASFFSVLFYSFFLIIVGLFMYGLEPNLEHEHILNFFLRIIDYPLLQGSLLAVLMYLVFRMTVNTLKCMSNIILKDFFNTFLSPVFNNDLSNKVALMFVAFIALLFSMIDINTVDLFFYSSCGNFPILIVPITLTILGLRTHRNCIYFSVAGGFFTTLLFVILTLDTDYCKFAFFPGMIGNIVFLIISHLYYVYFNISRRNLLLKIKSLFFKEKNFDELSDVDIFKSFINNDVVKGEMEYKIYRAYIYKFVLNKSVNFSDNSLDESDDFMEAVNNDILNLKGTKKVKSIK